MRVQSNALQIDGATVRPVSGAISPEWITDWALVVKIVHTRSAK